MQPKPDDYDYELDEALTSVVGVKTIIPADAFTAETLGTERAGHGVMIRNDGLVLTIGYLITEAETVWITHGGGRAVPGHVLAFDQETGFGLVQALARLELPALPLGSSKEAEIGERVVVAGAGGRQHAVAARIIAKQEFAGYWEYVLDEAIFTAPAHPNWGGTALIGPAGDLLGIGSLQIQQAAPQRRLEDVNMIVPIDLIKPILDDLLAIGRPNRPARPWLGVYATEVGNNVVLSRQLGLSIKEGRRYRPRRCRLQGARSCRSLPAHLGTGPSRGRGAAADQPRGQNLRAARQVVRPPPLPQRPGAALRRNGVGPWERHRSKGIRPQGCDLSPGSPAENWGLTPSRRPQRADPRPPLQLARLWPPRPSRSICSHQLDVPTGRLSAMNSW